MDPVSTALVAAAIAGITPTPGTLPGMVGYSPTPNKTQTTYNLTSVLSGHSTVQGTYMDMRTCSAAKVSVAAGNKAQRIPATLVCVPVVTCSNMCGLYTGQ